jgi:transcriptional regulator with XRE-family HTH domain
VAQSNSPTAVIAKRVRELRARRGWSAQRLADELNAVGVSWDRSIVANLENGRRQTVSVEEWLALSYVLDVAPINLLVPVRDNRSFAVVPEPRIDDEHARDGVVLAGDARQWVVGKEPLPGTDLRVYYSEVPETEFAARFGVSSWEGGFSTDDKPAE